MKLFYSTLNQFKVTLLQHHPITEYIKVSVNNTATIPSPLWLGPTEQFLAFVTTFSICNFLYVLRSGRTAAPSGGHCQTCEFPCRMHGSPSEGPSVGDHSLGAPERRVSHPSGTVKTWHTLFIFYWCTTRWTAFQITVYSFLAKF